MIRAEEAEAEGEEKVLGEEEVSGEEMAAGEEEVTEEEMAAGEEEVTGEEMAAGEEEVVLAVAVVEVSPSTVVPATFTTTTESTDVTLDFLKLSVNKHSSQS